MKRVCRSCSLFCDTNSCSSCEDAKFVNNYQGRISILNPDKSFVSKKTGFKIKGDFAIKFR